MDAIASARVVPNVGVEKLLECARRDVVERGDRFNTLALQIAELSAHIMAKVFAWLRPTEAVSELAQKLEQRWFDRQDLIDGHP